MLKTLEILQSFEYKDNFNKCSVFGLLFVSKAYGL